MPKSPTPTDAEKKSKKPKSKFHPRVIEEFVFVKSWLLCEMMSQLGAEEVQDEIYETMRCLMAPSGLKKLPCHNDNEKDIALWKKARTYEIKKAEGNTGIILLP